MGVLLALFAIAVVCGAIAVIRDLTRLTNDSPPPREKR
jgi:hypothetical protein